MADAADRLATIRAYVDAATEGPWWFDEDNTCWRLHGVMGRVPPQLSGRIPEQILNKQIIKAPKRNTPYAEYWPAPADGEFIVKARTDLPLLLDLVEALLETKPSMHGDHSPIPESCSYCRGEAVGLEKIRELITNYLAVAAEEATDQ